MKYHRNPNGDWLQCRAEKGRCPYGANADQDLPQIVERAKKAHREGKPLPILVDTAGHRRQFTFREDGGFVFGARTYDAAGELVPSERTRKARRLKKWAEFRQWSENERAERFDSDLLAFEVRQGQLKTSGLTGEQLTGYAAEHHGGSVAAFFRSVWMSFRHVPTAGERYRLTLDGMAQRVWKWLKGAAA